MDTVKDKINHHSYAQHSKKAWQFMAVSIVETHIPGKKNREGCVAALP